RIAVRGIHTLFTVDADMNFVQALVRQGHGIAVAEDGICPPVVLVLIGRGYLHQPQLASQALRVNDKVSDFHSNFLHCIVGGGWPARRPGDKVTSPCVALSYRGKSLENFTGEIQTKKFTAVPLAAWDGGFL